MMMTPVMTPAVTETHLLITAAAPTIAPSTTTNTSVYETIEPVGLLDLGKTAGGEGGLKSGI